jgi:very-short-patch-repair endonuclease
VSGSGRRIHREEAGRCGRVATEVDGLWHMDAAAWWADMRRGNELTASGLRVLRFPAFAVRDQPEVVAAQIAAALRLGGLAC